MLEHMSTEPGPVDRRKSVRTPSDPTVLQGRNTLPKTDFAADAESLRIPALGAENTGFIGRYRYGYRIRFRYNFFSSV